MNALEILGLSKVYKAKKGKSVQALTSLEFSVASGEVFGFLGPNGAGKSTTIKAVMGQIAPTGGSALIFGTTASDSKARMRVGYLPENPAFYDFMTAREYLLFVGRTFGMEPETIRTESERVLELLELSAAADRLVRGYSKGMVQRLGIAQAMLHDPDLYILDEPMSGLDPVGRALVKEIIRSLKAKGKTVFFSTHITADVEIVCDRVAVIVGGKLRSLDRVENILKSGVEGYDVQVRHQGPDADLFAGLEPRPLSAGLTQVQVPRERFNAFMALVIEAHAEIELIEPKRKDLEAFFLDIVAKSA